MEVDFGGKSPAEVAERDPDLMQIWGQINNAWDDIERLLYNAFDAMLSEETSFATQAVFYSQHSHAARRSMVEALARYALMNRPTTARKLKNALKRIEARSKDRNSLAHGHWTYGKDLATGEHGPQRMCIGSNIIADDHQFYSKRRLQDVLKKMRETAKDLAEAIELIAAAKRANSRTLSARHMAKSRTVEGE